MAARVAMCVHDTPQLKISINESLIIEEEKKAQYLQMCQKPMKSCR